MNIRTGLGTMIIQRMGPGTVLTLIDGHAAVVTDLQADVHGLPVIYTYEESYFLTTQICAFGKEGYSEHLSAAVDVINHRIHIAENATNPVWSNGKKWETQCHQWEIQHQMALQRLNAQHGGGMTYA